MTANLVLSMTTTGDKSESGISLEKVESGNVLTAMFLEIWKNLKIDLKITKGL